VDPGAGNTPGGLWDIMFGNGGMGGAAGTLFFSEGINGEADGLVGAITAPEPSSMALLGVACAMLGARRIRSRRRA